MKDPTTTVFAEVTLLLAATVACPYEEGHMGIIGNAEEGEDGRCPESTGCLLSACEAMTVEETKRLFCRSRELDSAAITGALHVDEEEI